MADWNDNGKASALWVLVGLASGICNIAAIIYVLVSKSRKKLFSILYIIGFIGPLIAYFVCRKEDRKLASISLRLAIGNAILAILVIALELFFTIGAFNTHTTISNLCIPTLGYSCSNPALQGGTLTLNFAQSTGMPWTQVNIFVVNGTQTPTAVPPLPCEEGFASISSGQLVSISLTAYSTQNTCIGFTKVANQEFFGNVWAGYRTSANSTESIVRVGTLTIKST